MKSKNIFIGGTNAMPPSKRIKAALMTLAIFAAAVVTGCNRSDDSDHRDSDHRMNHGNQNHPNGGNH